MGRQRGLRSGRYDVILHRIFSSPAKLWIYKRRNCQNRYPVLLLNFCLRGVHFNLSYIISFENEKFVNWFLQKLASLNLSMQKAPLMLSWLSVIYRWVAPIMVILLANPQIGPAHNCQITKYPNGPPASPLRKSCINKGFCACADR